MEDRTESPRAVKVEEHSRCVILTYFHGDAENMVDAHFTRALGKTSKAKAPVAKAKKPQKSIKLENNGPCQGVAVDSYTEPQPPPLPGRLLNFSPVDNTPGSWHSFSARGAEGPAPPTLAYALPQEGFSITGQEYATSLLNLLHSDRGEMGPSIASSSKPELLSSWTMPQGFRGSVDDAVGFENERRLDKKDLYWY